MDRAFLNPALLYLAASALGVAVLRAWTVRQPFELRTLAVPTLAQLCIVALPAFLLAGQASGEWRGAALAAFVAFCTSAGLIAAVPRLSAIGAIETSFAPLLVLFGAPWSYLLLGEANASPALLVLVIAMSLIGMVLAGLAACENFARRAVLTHRSWRRPFRSLPRKHSGPGPKVSIQVPCYAEPPELVIEVLNRIARLDYSRYEVIVCDNNTEDEALWRPLEEHVARLNATIPGDHFRFYHVAPIEGAKAGALNFCMEVMDPAAELVAVIDADYMPRPDFLSRLVGFFDDPAIGYVQTPHDYRRYDASGYLRACYWEYMPNNKVELPSLNEYDSAYTIGTMCIIRTQALQQAGGWAEWCLTEDSEVSVRMRALGYSGVYLGETFGRGLIPETFSDYKKQRFRWTAGPVQQLRRHWRLYLPEPFAAGSAMSGWSKLLEFQRGVAPLLQLAGLVTWALAATVLPVLASIGWISPIDVPDHIWAAGTIGVAAGLVTSWQRYRLSGCNRIADMVKGEIARMSLSYVQMIAGVAGLSSRPLAWRRTPKFPARASGLRALAATVPETAMGVGIIALTMLPLSFSEALGGDYAVAMAATGLLLAAQFLSAPVMAYLGERDIALGRRVPQYSAAPAGAAIAEA